MLLNVEQIIGYFEPPSNFDLEYTTNEKESVKDSNYSEFDKFYGNELKLFDDLHIASLIDNDKLYIYNISNIIFSENKTQDKFRTPNIASFIKISLPFTPSCNCSLFFDKYSSILTISVSSSGGQLYIIEISVFGNNDYNFSILTTRNFKTELSKCTSLTQVTNSLFLICSETQIFGIILSSEAQRGEYPPLFTIENLFSGSIDASTFIVLKTSRIDENTENIYLITFSGKSKELCLLLVRFNILENNACTCIIDRRSDILIGSNIETSPQLSSFEGTDLFVLLVNSTVYLYRVLNFDNCKHNSIRLQFSSYINLDFEHYTDNNKEVKLSPQIFCSKSEIYIAKAIFPRHISSSNDLLFPIYEIYKICLNNNSNSLPENNIELIPTLIWSQGLQNSEYNAFSYCNLKYQLNYYKDKLFSFEEMINFFLNRIVEECNSNIITEMALNRYLRFLKNTILAMVNIEKQPGLLNTLRLTNKFADLTHLIKNIYISIEEKSLFDTEYETCADWEFDEEKIIFLITPIHLFVNFFKNIGNYCIRIFSNKNNIFLLSPVSVSIISYFSEEHDRLSSLNFDQCSSYLYIPLDIIINYLKLKHMVLKMILNSNKIMLEEHLFDLFNLYSSDGISNKVIVLILVIELIEVFSHKIIFLNKLECIFSRYTSSINDNSKRAYLESINIKHYDVLTQNFTIDEFKLLIQYINKYFVQNKSTSNLEVLNFIEKTFKLSFIQNVNCSNLNSFEKSLDKYFKTSNFNLNKLVELKNIILILNICSNTTRSIYKYSICENLIRNAKLVNSQSFEQIIKFFSDESSFLNLGKYMTAGKTKMHYSYYGKINEYLSISSSDFIYRVYSYYSSIYRFFSSYDFINYASKNLSFYIGSCKVFWELFLHNFCCNQVNQEFNFHLIDLVYDYLENQIINGCFDQNYVRYIFYLINLFPYKRYTLDSSLSIINQLLENIKLVDELIELFESKDNNYQNDILKEFSSKDLRVIYFISLIINLFNQSRIKTYNNSIYIYLIQVLINLICTSIPNCLPSQRILLNKIHRKYLVQYLYLCEGDVEDRSIIELLNKSLLFLDSKYEKILFLMTLWTKHYLSIKFNKNSELLFSTISNSVFRSEIKEFYSILIKIFWKKLYSTGNFYSETSLKFYMEGTFMTQSIYSFLLNTWRREERFQEIVTLAYLNALAKYCDLFSSNDKINTLFPKDWLEFRLRNDFAQTKIDSFQVLKEVFEILEGLFQNLSCEKQVVNTKSESLNSIISSLSTYIIYSSITLSGKSSNCQHAYQLICIPNIFFGIEFPKIANEGDTFQDIHHKVTYLPSIAYISYLKWYFVGVKKLTSSILSKVESCQYFNNVYCKYLEKYKTCLKRNGIYFNSEFIPYDICSKNIKNVFNISIVELNYHLVINGYFETAFRLSEIANKFIDNLEKYSKNLSINNGYLNFSNPLTKFQPSNIYNTIGFWMFNYCFFLSSNTKYFNTLVEYTNDFLVQTRRKKKKKLSLNSPELKIVAFEEIFFQNAKFRSLLDCKDNLTFAVKTNFWSSILDRMNYSPSFLQGVHTALLVNEQVYAIINVDNPSENPYTSILPIQLKKIYKDPEFLIEAIRNGSPSSDNCIHILINIVENLLNFSFIDEALKFISVVISDYNLNLPIYFVAKVRYLIRSSNDMNINLDSEEFESLIYKCISIDNLGEQFNK